MRSFARLRSFAFVGDASACPASGVRPWSLAFLVGHASACPGDRSSPLSGFYGARQISPASRRPAFRYETEETPPAAATGLFRGVLKPVADAMNGQTPAASRVRPRLAEFALSRLPCRRPTNLSGLDAACLRARSRRNSPGCVDWLVARRAGTRRGLMKSAHCLGQLHAMNGQPAASFARFRRLGASFARFRRLGVSFARFRTLGASFARLGKLKHAPHR
jgi:hypothetical protein